MRMTVLFLVKKIFPIEYIYRNREREREREREMDSSTMMDLTSKSQNAQLRHAKILQELEVKRRMNTVVVPTLLQDVIDKLREIGHPITLFGEKPEDRLRRLKFVVATREVEDEEAGVVRDMVSSKDSPSLERRLQEQQQQQQQQKKKRFYTPASSSLQNARKDIASYSFERSQKRLKGINEDRDDLKKYRVNQEYAVSLYNTLNNLLMTASQIGDHRPLTSCSFSKDDNSKYLATSSWSGLVKLWDRTVLDDANDEEEKRDSKDMCKLTYRGHDSRVQFVDFHPHSCCSDKGAPSAKSANLATASVDSTSRSLILFFSLCLSLSTLISHLNIIHLYTQVRQSCGLLKVLMLFSH